MSTVKTDPQTMLDYVQRERLALAADDLDPRTRIMLLSSMSQTSTAQLRINVDGDSVKAKTELAGALLLMVSKATSPGMVPPGPNVVEGERIDASALDAFEPIEGELSTEVSSVTFEEFVEKKMSP